MQLPQGVRIRSGRYYLVKRDGATVRGTGLTGVAAGDAALLDALQQISTASIPTTIGDLLLSYLHNGTHELSPATRREYERAARSRLVAVFGHMPISALRQSHIARYLEQGRVERRPVLANRERAVLSSAYEYGMRNGWAESNPCRGVRRNKERPSRVEVTDAQYLDAYRRAPQCLRNLMHVGYLTGLRLVDLSRLRWDWVSDDGIAIDESKTGHKRFIEMTSHLRLALQRARDYAPQQSPFVLVAARGQRWLPWAVQSAWKRLDPGFPFRAIRAKAATDADAAGHNVLGHHGQMLTRYVRRERLRPVA